jgi:hypothetical protein
MKGARRFAWLVMLIVHDHRRALLPRTATITNAPNLAGRIATPARDLLECYRAA